MGGIFSNHWKIRWAVLAVAGVLAGGAGAQDRYVWNFAPGTLNWYNDPGVEAWVPESSIGPEANPPDNTVLLFGGFAGATLTNNGAWVGCGIEVGSNAGSFTLDGNPITLGDYSGVHGCIRNTLTDHVYINFDITGDDSGVPLDLDAGGERLTIHGAINNNGADIEMIGGETHLHGVVSGAGKLIVRNGYVFLEDEHTFTGDIELQQGVVYLATGGAVTTGRVDLGDSGQPAAIAWLGFYQATGGLCWPRDIVVHDGNDGRRRIQSEACSGTNLFTGTITLDARLDIYDSAGGSLAFTNVISGSKGLRLSGNSSLFQFDGANTYEGGTTVSGAWLIAANTHGSACGTGALTVAANGRLGGGGMVCGPVTVQNRGKLQPGVGSDCATLTISNNLTMEAGSTNQFDLNGTSGATDRVDLKQGGTLTISGAVAFVGSPRYGSACVIATGLAARVGTFSSTNGLAVGWRVHYGDDYIALQGPDVTPASGPFTGGNTMTVTNGPFGTITNVTIGGVAATIQNSGSDWVRVTVPSVGTAGAKDIVIQTSGNGAVTLAGAYTVNPAGVIGVMEDDWTRWSEVAGLPGRRARLAAASFNGGIYAMGGYFGVEPQTWVYRYDGTNWTEVDALPAARAELAACEYNGGLYAIGGTDYWEYRDTTYRYDGTNWTEVAALPGILGAEAAGTLNGKMYTMGGFDGSVGKMVYEFDGASWSWPDHDLPAFRMYLAAGTLNGRLYAIGGEDFDEYANVYAFDGTNWQGVASLPAARSGLTAGVLDGRLYAIGGRTFSSIHTNVYRYDGTNWQEVAGLPTTRCYHASAVLNGVIYAMGGYTMGSSDAQTNVFRYPGRALSLGTTPASGSITGGYQVVIVGDNLGNGADITNVMLCGVSVSNITSQSATQVVVVAGASGSSSTGDVVVFSTSYGETIKSNGFSYEGSTLVVLYDFYMQQANGGVSVCWQTASEEDTVGFDLFRWDGDAWVKVNDVLIPGSGEMGGSYRVADAAADAENTFRYKLVEYETDGGMQEYGPFDVAAINLRLENIAITPEGVVLRWLSREQDSYEVQKSLDISNGFSPLATGLPATPPVNVYTDQTETANGAIYRVRVE